MFVGRLSVLFVGWEKWH